jgi:hypothetical protein
MPSLTTPAPSSRARRRVRWPASRRRHRRGRCLRLLHRHRDHDAGGPGLLPQGRGRALRAGRAHHPRRAHPDQHAWWPAVASRHSGMPGSLFHFHEVVQQLRGECGERQVPGAPRSAWCTAWVAASPRTPPPSWARRPRCEHRTWHAKAAAQRPTPTARLTGKACVKAACCCSTAWTAATCRSTSSSSIAPPAGAASCIPSASCIAHQALPLSKTRPMPCCWSNWPKGRG